MIPIPVLFGANVLQYVFGILMFLTAIFLMLIILVQRGRGGGLAGAFGGLGGQSAFGTKAGDLFTRITIGVAAFWIILCVVALKVLSTQKSGFGASGKTTISTTETGQEGDNEKESDNGAGED